MTVIDLDARMTFAYVMNKMGEGTTGDRRAATILAAVYSALASGSRIEFLRTRVLPADSSAANTRMVAELG